jgi:hypothetical protein
MSYDPFEHRPSPREIVAAWIICLGIAGLGVGLTAGHEAPAAAPQPMPAAQAGPVSRPSVNASPGAAEAAPSRVVYGRINQLMALSKRSAARPMPT